MKRKTLLLFLTTTVILGSAALCTHRAFAQEAGTQSDLTDADAIVTEGAMTQPDETHTCMVSYYANLPVHFTHSIRVHLKNMDTAEVYELILRPENGYRENAFVTPGAYMTTEISVPGDTIGAYVFVYNEDFILGEENAYAELYTMLENEAEVTAAIDGRLALTEGTDPSDGSDEEDTEDHTFGLSSEDPTVDTDYEVTHTGTGTGLVGITGDANAKYRLEIRVETGGVPGNMTIRYAMNGIWSEEIPVRLSGSLELAAIDEKGTQSRTGLTAHFEAPAEGPDNFVSGDCYTAFIPDPSTDVDVDHKGDGTAELTVSSADGDPDVYDALVRAFGEQTLEISVLRGGSFGEAVIGIGLTDGETLVDEMIVPGNGEIVIPGTQIVLTFTGNESKTLFCTGDCYGVTAEKTDYTIQILVVLLVLACIGGILFFLFDRYMKKHLPPDTLYHIHPYTPMVKETRPVRGKTGRNRKERRWDDVLS